MHDRNSVPLEGEDQEETGDGSPTVEPGIDWASPNPLQSRRDHLHAILDNCFPEIAWKVNSRPLNTDDVKNVFRICARLGEDPVICLLATKLDQVGESQARECIGNLPTQKEVNKLAQLRREVAEFSAQLFELSSKIQHGSALQQQAKAFLRSRILIPGEQVCPAVRSLDQDLRRLKKEYSASIAKRETATRLLFVSEVYFARWEFINLQQKGRYKILTPRIMANALAGLPFMGYRTSADICSRFEPSSDGLQFEIFKLVDQLASHYRSELTKQESTDLVIVLKNWIESLPDGTPAIADIKRNGTILIDVVQGVEKRQLHRADVVPYAIARLFAFLKRHRTQEYDLICAINQFLSNSNQQ